MFRSLSVFLDKAKCSGHRLSTEGRTESLVLYSDNFYAEGLVLCSLTRQFHFSEESILSKVLAVTTKKLAISAPHISVAVVYVLREDLVVL